MKRNRMFTTLSLAALTGMAVLLVKPVQADQSAVNLLQPHVQWVLTQPNGKGNYSLEVTMVSNQSDDLVTSYGSNINDPVNIRPDLPYLNPAVLSFYANSVSPYSYGFAGDAKEFFNDRMWPWRSEWGTNLDGSPKLYPYYAPFSPWAPERLRINLDAQQGRLLLTRYNRGYTITADLKAVNGLLLGSFTYPQRMTVLVSVRRKFIEAPTIPVSLMDSRLTQKGVLYDADCSALRRRYGACNEEENVNLFRAKVTGFYEGLATDGYQEQVPSQSATGPHHSI